MTPNLYCKYITTAVMLLYFGLAAMAWTLTKSCHLPRVADAPDIETYEGIEPGPSGKDALWDFSAAMVSHYPAKLWCTGVPDSLLTARFGKHRAYYRVKGDTLLWQGFENRHVNLRDSVGTLYMRFPMCYGDSCALEFDFKGSYYLEHPAANKGKGFVKADGTGTLVMPGGDTVTNVMRVCRSYYGLPEARLSRQSPKTASLLESESIYREYDWYARGYRYPLFSLRQSLSFDRGREVLVDSYAYAFTRHAQISCLKDDAENDRIRAQEGAGSLTDETFGEASPISDISITDNGSEIQVELEYALPECYVEIIISNSSGVAYFSVPKTKLRQGQNRITVPVNSLPEGEYALMLLCGGMRYPCKFTHR